MGPRTKLLVVPVVALGAVGLSGCDPLQPWDSALVSVSHKGEAAAAGWSGAPALSADGTKVAFVSDASDLVPTDTNGGSSIGLNDVFVRDLTTGRTELVSANADGSDSGDSPSWLSGIAPDGTAILFRSAAGDLVPGDAGTSWDLFERDLATGTTTLLSGEVDLDVEDARYSADGTEVVIVAHDVYVHDLATGGTALATPAATGAGGADRPSYGASFSPDGTEVTFHTEATNLVTGDANGHSDVYVRDLAAGVTTLVSRNLAGSGNASSFGASFSPDGMKVAFRSEASDLGPTDTNGASDVYLHDLTTGATSLVSANASGTDSGNAPSSAYDVPRFLPDGRVVFDSDASDLGPVDNNGAPDVYVRDPSAGRSDLVSVDAEGSDSGNGASANARPTPAGQVLFTSSASDLGPADRNGELDVYLRDLDVQTTTLVSTTRDGHGAPDGHSDARQVPSEQVASTDGRTVVYVSEAPDVADADTNGTRDVFVATFAAADLGVAVSASPEPLATGQTVTYHVVVGNAGPDEPEEASLALLVGEGASFVEVDSSAGSCTPPSPDVPGLVTCTFGDVPVGEVAEVSVTATVTAPAGATVRTIVATSSPSVDPDGSDDVAVVDSTVAAP